MDTYTHPTVNAMRRKPQRTPADKLWPVVRVGASRKQIWFPGHHPVPGLPQGRQFSAVARR